MNILKTEGIYLNFGEFKVLNGVDLSVDSGEVRSVIGPNGAGKTTLFNVISGKYRPNKGKIFFKDKNITGKSPDTIAQYGIAKSFQIGYNFDEMTVIENITFPVLVRYKLNKKLLSFPKNRGEIKDSIEKVLVQTGLKDMPNILAKNLSHGNKKKLDIGIGLARHPELLLLDEPMAGLNSEEIVSVINLIKDISKNEKLTIVLIEHDMETVFAISDYISVLQHGNIIAEGIPEVVRRNDAVIEAYLGKDF